MTNKRCNGDSRTNCSLEISGISWRIRPLRKKKEVKSPKNLLRSSRKHKKKSLLSLEKGLSSPKRCKKFKQRKWLTSKISHFSWINTNQWEKRSSRASECDRSKSQIRNRNYARPWPQVGCVMGWYVFTIFEILHRKILITPFAWCLFSNWSWYCVIY